MSGRVLAIGLLIFAAVFGAALWWFQTRAYYDAVEGVTEVEIAGVAVPVEDWRGIDAGTSPLKLRACFRLLGDLPAGAPGGETEAATPLVAPDWFDCFDAPEIEEGLADGRFVPVLAARNAPWGFDRFVAYDPQTRRGWMWRQLNRCGQSKFDGDPLPAGCDAPPEG